MPLVIYGLAGIYSVHISAVLAWTVACRLATQREDDIVVPVFPVVVPVVVCVSTSTVNKYLNLLVRENMKLQLILR